MMRRFNFTSLRAILLVFTLAAPLVEARTWDLERDGGAIRNNATLGACWRNGAAFNTTLAMLGPGDTLLVPGNATFHLMGGIQVANKDSVTLQIDGTLVYSDDMKAWPRNGNGKDARVFDCMTFKNMSNFTITSGLPEALIDGQGAAWWGIPGIGYLEIGENRPRLLAVQDSKDVLIEHLFLKNSPYWNTLISNVDGLEIRYCRIEAWRISNTTHTDIDLTAFNTDGFDFTGRNIHVHHCTVWNQDDSFCIKDGTENVLVEHVNASGLGLTIGSISSTVRNITFRHAYMYHSYKGIYMKFRGPGLIADVLYENITIDGAEQYPIWIGPAQQSDDKKAPCAAHPCSLCWPLDPLAECNAPANATYVNITLRNIQVLSPKVNPGVILANASSPMQNIVFDNVVVVDAPTKPAPWGRGYLCKGVSSGVALGGTTPVPDCFEDRTNH